MDIFKDPEVEFIRNSGNALTGDNGITIMLPSRFGFCNGVRGAIKGVTTALHHQAPEKIWMLGRIIHNPTVNRQLREKGIKIVQDDDIEAFFQTAQADDSIVIPAFGITKTVMERLQRHFPSSSIIDTTCHYVKRSWSRIEEATDRGYTILVFGDPAHPEIKATVSRADPDKSALIYLRHPAAAQSFAASIESGNLLDWPKQDINNPAALNLTRLALLTQTTLLDSDITRVTTLLRKAAAKSGGELLCLNTICRATRQRQNAALELCRQGCDLLLVIGGYTSSNTNQLYRIAKTYTTTYFISNAAMLSPTAITHYIPTLKTEKKTRNWRLPTTRRIGLLAGASCPASDIGAVIRRLRSLP